MGFKIRGACDKNASYAPNRAPEWAQVPCDPPADASGSLDSLGRSKLSYLQAGRVLSLLVVVLLVGAATAALAGPDSIDPSYGDGGSKIVDFLGEDDLVTDIAIQADGKVLV